MEEGLQKLRELVGQNEHLVYEAIKARRVSDLSRESQFLAKAIEEHSHLSHVHNALEFADVRQGQRYEIQSENGSLSPMAHIYTHAAVKGQIEDWQDAKAAFEKLTANGASTHHAEHVLGALLMQAWGEAGHPNGIGPERATAQYEAAVKRLGRDSMFCKKWIRNIGCGHPGLE